MVEYAYILVTICSDSSLSLAADDTALDVDAA